jgi:methyl-accepting chemotaxis protein
MKVVCAECNIHIVLYFFPILLVKKNNGDKTMRLNLRISRKLVIGFAIVVILTAAIGVMSYINLGQIAVSAKLIDNADQIQRVILEARRDEKNYIIQGDTSDINKVHNSTEQLVTICNEIKTMGVNAATVGLLNSVEESNANYKKAFDDYVSLTTANAAVLTEWKAIGAGFNNEVLSLKKLSDEGGPIYLQVDKLETTFVLMRVAALYYIRTPSDTTWGTFVTAMNSTKTEAKTMTTLVSNDTTLSTSATAISDYIDSYIAQGDIYHQNEVTKVEKDAVMVEAGNFVIGNADPRDAYYGGGDLLRANAVSDMNSLQASSNTMVIGFVAASTGVGIVVAFLIIRSIQNPLKTLIEDAKIISEGTLGYQMKTKDRKDEIGAVITAIKNMVKNTADPIGEIQKIASNVAQGDLSQKIDIHAKGDLQKLVDSFATMVNSLRELVGKAKTAVETVASMSQEVGSTAEEVNAGMEQVSTATQNISRGSQKLTNLAQEVSKNVNTLSSILQQTGGITCDSIRFGEKSTEIMRKIQADGSKASTSIESMQNAILNTAQTVGSMHASLEKIGELANMVTDVASQTEMLALNAAIEAARAGEAGRGFAVVADAVKELSDQSSNAATETLESVSQVKKKGEEALEVSKKSTAQATEGAATIKASIEGTKNVAEVIDKINAMLTDVGKGVEQGVLAVEQVVKAIDEVSSISEQSASACEENSAAMEQQTASMNQLAQTSSKLSEVATQLQKEIDKFKL